MPTPPPSLSRRRWLQCTGALAALGASAARAQGDQRPIAIAQIADMSPLQQDVSRDFLAGARAAWQDINARGGIRGRAVQHVVLETDGTPEGLHAAWRQLPSACVALSGCVGDATAAAVAALQAASGASAPLAHAAPWLYRQQADEADLVFGIFPDYQAQISHAVKSLATMGVQRIGVVFASAGVQRQLHDSVAQAARNMGLEARTLPLPSADDRPAPPAEMIVLFVGGTPELHDYVRRISMPAVRQCYVVALADVNLQVLAQMGGTPRNVSVIATQAVPMVTAGLPIVRAYREVLARLYDEPPSPQSLAGFISARYTAEVVASVQGPLTRASVLAAFRKRSDMHLDGFTVAYQGRRLASAPVTQSMLAADGRIIG